MKGKYRDVRRYAILAVCYGLLCMIWLYRGFFREQDISGFDVALGLVWLVGAVIWAVRAVRKYKEIKTSKEN